MSTKETKTIARIGILNQQEGTILLNRRPGWSKLEANKLQILGGKIKGNGESPEQGAQRELSEELGLDIDIHDLIYICSSENNGWTTFAFLLLLDQAYQQTQMPNHGEFDVIEAIQVENILTLIENEEIAFDHPAILIKFLDYIEENSILEKN